MLSRLKNELLEAQQFVAPNNPRSPPDTSCHSYSANSSLHVSSIKVKYSWSIECCLKRKVAMPPRRSTRSPRSSEGGSQKRPNPKQKAGTRRTRGRKKRARSEQSEVRNGEVDTNDYGARDLIEIIDTNEAQRASTELEVHSEVARGGACDSEEDRLSASSVSSGPSIPHYATHKNPSSSSTMCSACHKLHQKAKRVKKPMKDKLLDNDPESLTCDQWVLIKIWRPRRIPNFNGRLLRHIHLMKRRIVSNEAILEERRPSGCCRPHVFLQRTIQKVMRVSDKREVKRKGRKRPRNNSQVPCVAKQQRLGSSGSRNEPHDGDHLSPERAHVSGLNPVEFQSEVEMDDTEDTHLTIELIPSGVTMEKPSRSMRIQPKDKAAKKKSEFRDLLAQMRGNSSVIIKEKQ